MTPKEARFARMISYMMWSHAAWQSPSVREIGTYMGWSSTSTTYKHLNQLLDAKLIVRVEGLSRRYRVTDAGLSFLQSHGGMQIDTSRA